MTVPADAAVFNLNDRATQLNLIASSGACQADRVIVLDFSILKTRVGQRWESKRETVWAQVERTIARHVSPHTSVCRADETEYVVCFSAEKGFEAQTIGFRIIEEVLTYFLGQCSRSDLIVRSVTAILDGDIVASDVVCEPEHLTRSSPPKEAAPSLLLAPPPPAMTAIIEDRVRLTCSIEDIIHLKSDAPSGSRIGVRYFDLLSHRLMTEADRSALPTPILLKCDLHILKIMNFFLSMESTKPIIAPVSIQLFGSSMSRFTLFDKLQATCGQERRRLIVELSGLEIGTPASRMTEAMTLLKPFCRSVMARITPGRTGFGNARLARIPALTVNACQIGGDDARLAAGLLAFGEAAKTVAPTLIAAELPSESFLPVCAVAGFTHATVAKT